MAKSGPKPVVGTSRLLVLTVRFTGDELAIVTRAARKERKTRADFVRDVLKRAIEKPCTCAA